MFHFYTTSTCYEYFYLEISIFSEILEEKYELTHSEFSKIKLRNVSRCNQYVQIQSLTAFSLVFKCCLQYC